MIIHKSVLGRAWLTTYTLCPFLLFRGLVINSSIIPSALDFRGKKNQNATRSISRRHGSFIQSSLMRRARDAYLVGHEIFFFLGCW
ncbi:hypothetical protein BU24DRAFT_220979 [Aaosphaeria arxii CBS 175.79]|uniref:Uncharacterized protein n=1 Tax=Aaosphaeria arxii CBS 175.79 TaxID=1450172 RepID=A0A6A5XPS6_9PLEO|nr:uncharacterized protein BU24DRAFT_220979 [Aaosphaeria arxii CBS 175.79]KAF2014761.1 hypothetical protein BU24DRAFT_220979 [Aaosphaeria arxii CBS 175.79]